MKCNNPKCEKEIDESERFCPYCGQKQIPVGDASQTTRPLSPVADVQMAHEVREQPTQVDFKVVKNKIVLQMPSNVVACKLGEEYFDSLDHASGIILPEGITAVVCVNGKEVMQLAGGIYDFASQEKVDELLDKRVVDWKSLSGMAVKTWRGVMRILGGRKVEERVYGETDYDFHSMDEVVEYANRKSLVSFYLKRDNRFMVRYDMKDAGQSVVVRTSPMEVQMGISLLMRITDFRQFTAEYLTEGGLVTVHTLGRTLLPLVTPLLQYELQGEEVGVSGLSDEAVKRAEAALIGLGEQLEGVVVEKVLEVSCTNEALERFRQVSQEMYVEEKELDFLMRTNDFKNRLVGVENEQKLKEVRNDFEMQKMLDEINKDGLLHEDEVEQFRILLSRQKRIREANDELEVEKAMMDIARTRLLNHDELEAFAQGINQKKMDRQNVEAMMRLQSIALLNRKERELQEEFERMQHQSDIRALQDKQELDALQGDFEIEQILKGAKANNELIDIKLDGQRKVDTYEAEKADAEAVRERKRREEDLDIRKKEEEINWEGIHRKQQAGLDALEKIKQMKEREAAGQHGRDLEMKKVEQAHETELRDYDYRERMAALENEKNYSAEQLMVTRLDKLGGDNKAAEIMAESFSSKNKLEAERAAQEKIDRERRERDADTKDMMNRMWQMQQQNMENMVNMFGNATAQRREETREHFDRLERISTARMGEIEHQGSVRFNDMEEQKELFRSQMMHEQQRHDQHQDRALGYTTKLAEAEHRYATPQQSAVTQPSAPVKKEYIVESMGNVPFHLSQLQAFVQNCVIGKGSILQVDGKRCYAADVDELRETFARCEQVVCPNCGEKVRNVKFCSKCGQEL